MPGPVRGTQEQAVEASEPGSRTASVLDTTSVSVLNSVPRPLHGFEYFPVLLLAL